MAAISRRIVRWCKWLAILGTIAGLFIAAVNWWIVASSGNAIVSRAEDVPPRSVALVLGTGRFAGDGVSPNPFFNGRLDAAAELFHYGKAEHLLLSGDNSRTGYDEPAWMREGLVKRGVPEKAITLDYAGFRTLDSVVRARAVFGLSAVIIVSDDFHLPRALFLARSHGLDAIGCRSESVPWRWSNKTRIREVGSRVKAWLDVYVLRTKPKFYGSPVSISTTASA